MSSPVIQILAPTTPPPASPRRQRHAPRSAGHYREYRACLRWDAGFTCCFCLVHESDLDARGVEGTGLTSIEHIEPQVRAPDLVRTYGNCAYACRFCNTVRRDQPVEHPSGARLLHPWRDAWGEHFRLCDDRLEPVHQGLAGQHARYTAQVYRINDTRRIQLRRERRELIQDRVRLFTLDSAELRHAAKTHLSPVQRRRLIEMVRELESLRRRALLELHQRSPVPRDAPSACRCDDPAHCCLPPAVSVIELRV